MEQLPDCPLFEDFRLPGAALVVLFGVLPLVPLALLARHDPRG